jgi:NDP-sugar pyrophosphorylase family protein
MKAVILAGGLGTRISEETHLKPKPMIEIGSKPVLWHIILKRKMGVFFKPHWLRSLIFHFVRR